MNVELDTVVIPAVSILVMLLGICLTSWQTNKANKIAEKADRRSELAEQRALRANERSDNSERRAERAEKSALWSPIQGVLQKLAVLDPANEPEQVHERFQELRIEEFELIDGFPEWNGFGDWLSSEHQLGSLLARERYTQSPQSETPDQILANLIPFQDWVVALSQNLRVIRHYGFHESKVQLLHASAQSYSSKNTQRNQWKAPEPFNFTRLEEEHK